MQQARGRTPDALAAKSNESSAEGDSPGVEHTPLIRSRPDGTIVGSSSVPLVPSGSAARSTPPHPSPEDCGLGVLRCRGEFSLLAATPLPADRRLFTIHGDLTSVPSRYSVQIDENLHVDLGEERELDELLDGYFWRFMNHSCAPNAAIRGREVVAIREIEPWEQIAFDYNTTEFAMAEPFDCRCGSRRCVGRVGGFRFLDQATRERLRPLLAEHLLRHLDRSFAEAAR